MFLFCFTKISNQAFFMTHTIYFSLQFTVRFLYMIGYSGPWCGIATSTKYIMFPWWKSADNDSIWEARQKSTHRLVLSAVNFVSCSWPQKSKVDTVVKENQSAEIHVEPIPNVGPATNLRIAQYGIDPTNVTSTGPKGLVKEDVVRHIQEKNLQPVQLKKPTPEPTPAAIKDVPAPVETVKEKRPKIETPARGATYVDIPLTTMRSVIAKRLVQSKQGSPHGYATAECNINAISKIRQDFMSSGIKISLNDLIIKAAATTLQYVPEVNSNIISSTSCYNGSPRSRPKKW